LGQVEKLEVEYTIVNGKIVYIKNS
jgi:hypothetical protein